MDKLIICELVTSQQVQDLTCHDTVSLAERSNKFSSSCCRLESITPDRKLSMYI